MTDTTEKEHVEAGHAPQDTAEKSTAEDKAPASAGREKRERKKTDFFQVTVKEKEEFVIKPGKGSKLGEIPNVHHQIGKLKSESDVLVSIHTILFKRAGTSTKRKRDIYEFSGFVFGEDEAKEKEKLTERLSKLSVTVLHQMMDCFDIPQAREGQKPTKVQKIVDFLMEPKKLGEKDLAALEEAKKEKAKRKRSAKKEKASKRKPVDKKKPAKKDKDSESEDEESSEPEEEEEEEEEAEAPPPKKTPKTEGKKAPASAKKKTSKKGKKDESEEEDDEQSKDEEEEEEEEKAPPKKRTKKSDAAEGEAVASPKGKAKKEEGPASPKQKKAAATPKKAAEGAAEKAAEDGLPSDEELRGVVLGILKGVNVNQFNLKQLLASLAPKFPGVNLGPKKAFIKDLAIDYCQTHANQTAAEPEAQEAPAAADTEAAKAEKKEEKPEGESAAAEAAPEADGDKDAKVPAQIEQPEAMETEQPEADA